MEDYTETAGKITLFMILSSVALDVSCEWEENSFFQLHNHVTKIMNTADCWICSCLLTHSHQGHPMAGLVFPNTTETGTTIDRNPLTEYTSKEGLNWRLDLYSLWNDTTLEVPFVQQCFLNSTSRGNYEGNRTDPGCRNLTFIGN